jgi:hypothetical protein
MCVQVVTWSAAALYGFGPWYSWGKKVGTKTAFFDPVSGLPSGVAGIYNTEHDMFCPGTMLCSVFNHFDYLETLLIW